MNHVEVMKQALEALESVLCDPDGNVCWHGSYADRDIIGDALAVFRAAIAEAAVQEPVALTDAIRSEPTEMIHKWRALELVKEYATAPAAPCNSARTFNWGSAPSKTQWGPDMVVADIEIDKDHTLTVFCERGQTEKAEALFRRQPPAAQPAAWVGLERKEIISAVAATHNFDSKDFDEIIAPIARAIEAKLREKNAAPAAQPAAPKGWKLAPVEPTQEMCNAAYTYGNTGGLLDPYYAYKAMLDAAPEKGQP